jgi:Fe-S cluster assembly iron-binding protein IscA
MVLDGPREDDEVVNKNGNTFIINKELLKQVQPVKVDFVETDRGSGYAISSNLSSGGGCGGGSCSC